MKYSFLIPLLFLVGCGDSTSILPSPEPAPQAAVTPPPVDSKPAFDSRLVGNWIDEGTNTLAFKADGTVLDNNSSLEWMNDQDYIVFSQNELQIDICHYSISTEGHLHESISIILNLICAQSGNMRYTKQP